MDPIRMEIVIDPSRTDCGLGIRIEPSGGAAVVCFAETSVVDKPLFVRVFNYAEKNKNLAERHLALLLLLALARAEPALAAGLGFEPDPDGAVSFPAIARLGPFRRYREAESSEQRRRDFRKDVQSHFKGRNPEEDGSEESTRGVVVVTRGWKIGLRPPSMPVRFAEGAAAATVSWLESLSREAPEPAEAPSVSLERLPRVGPHVFGREREIALLDAALEDPATSIALVVGWGGVGKSTLVSHWIASRAPEYARATRVFGWSFYTQGSRAAGAASADSFIDEALRFFGDQAPNKGSPAERGKRLSELIRSRRTILILDGLEPLQDPAEGTLRDPALRTLLRSLSARMNGLCVVTTRPPFHELDDREAHSVRRIDLERLSEEAGAALLRSLGVRGGEEELRAAAKEQRGHALTLTLLGRFLADARGGDVQRRAGVTFAAESGEDGRHAWRVMEEYDRWFSPGPERAALRLVGLFDRPGSADLVRALRREPAIAGVTDALVGLGDDAWNRCLARLRRARLLLEDGGDGSVDAHPLVREFFGALLEKENPAGFRAAHGRLFEHLRDHGKRSPDTAEDELDEIEPLFRAIWHGASARRTQEAFDLYRGRLRRNNVHFTLYQLNAVSADLAAQSAFFDADGRLRSSGLTRADEGWLLSARAFSLRALGDVERARALLVDSSRVHAEEGGFMDASVAEGNLAEMSTLLGDLRDAMEHGQREIDFARRSGVAYMHRLTLGHHAHLLHYQGRIVEARAAVEDARAMVASCPPDYPLLALYDDVVFVWWYWELLLDATEAVEEEAFPVLHPEPFWQVGRAFVQLVRGRLEAKRGNRDRAEHHLTTAIHLLRDGGDKTWLATGLLARATAAALDARPWGSRGGSVDEEASRDLEEALAIANAAGLRLLQCDALLLQARVAAWRGALPAAESDLASARRLVRKTGYELREADESLAAAWIAVQRGDRAAASAAVAKARERIEARGVAARRDELSEIERRLSEMVSPG